jgi:isocitrate lyase
MADVIFTTIQDRRNKNILSIRDQNTFNQAFRKKRLMTLIHLFLIHRYKNVSVHYVSPTDDNQKQTEKMKKLEIFSEVNIEVGQIIVAEVNTAHVKKLLNPDQDELKKLISKNSG